MVSCSSKVSFVGRYAEAVHLAVGMWDCSRTDAAEGFPESAVAVSFRALSSMAAPQYRIVWS